MKIFVTGSTGVVGRRLVPLLLEQGYEVSVAVRTTSRPPHGDRVRRLLVDLFDRMAVARATEGHDTIISLATKIPSSNRAFLPGAWNENNRLRTEGVSNLSEAAKVNGVSRFIQESVALMYPDRGSEWIYENEAIDPRTHVMSAVYAESQAQKLEAEGCTPVVLRFGNFYGRDSGHTRDMMKFVRRRLAPSFGDPDGYISSVTTDDAARAVAAALAVPKGTYNVSDDDPLTKRDFFTVLANELRVREPRFLPRWIKHLTGSVGETLGRSQRLSNSLLKEASNWRPMDRNAREGWARIVRDM